MDGNASDERPSDAEVVEAIRQLTTPTTARALCMALQENGYTRGDSQIAIQRALVRGKLVIGDNLRLSLRAMEAA